MAIKQNNQNKKRLPTHLRNWVIGNMIAMNKGVLPSELADEFITFLEEKSGGAFADELQSCLDEANRQSENEA